MGMSASQARLLSITSRLTNNEFRSQTITNSKLRLATESTEASQEYMDALDSKQLMYMYYDDNGSATKISMTPAVIYDYSPLKNQYAIKNASGKILVSNQDATNFKETNSLSQFLERYGLTNNSQYNAYLEQMKKYNEDLAKYRAEKAVYDVEYSDYLEKYKQYRIDYQAWLDSKDKPDLYAQFTAILGTSESPRSCYSSGLSGGTGCYIHVLAHLLDWPGDDTASHETYTASNGQTTGLDDSDVWGAAMHSIAISQNYKAISDEIALEEKLCDGDDNLIPAWKNGGVEDKTKENIIQQAIDEGRVPTEKEILSSDYIYDADTNSVVGIKTLKQKAIDLLYMLKNNMLTTRDEQWASLVNFTDGDMKNINSEEPEKPVAPIPPAPPQEPVRPLYEIKLKDKDKSQWYTNLWFAMNGSETANLVMAINKDNEEELKKDPTLAEYMFYVNDANRNELTTNYEIFEDNLYTSSTWLEFALEHGIVTLDRAQYQDPSEDSGKSPRTFADAITWNSIAYTNATDIVAVDDEKAIAIAEVKYKKRITEIENQDKKYDQDLKKLDNEHNALQTEYESIKEVISKNVERSFKAFS